MTAPGTPERFDHYVERCLYHPERGFYAAGGGVAGRRRGDFITSPEVGPLFADVLARVIDACWDEAGRPAELAVYDIGTGPGTLAAGLRRAAGPSAGASRVVGVDVHPGADLHPDDLPDALDGAVVIANELLDNLPFRVVERTAAGWCEVDVVTAADGSASESLRAVEDPGLDLPVGCRAPLLERAGTWVADILARRPALLLVVDYGAPTTAGLAERGGWLRTYRRHDRGDDPLADPGARDITTDVALDQLPPPDDVTDQATFLRRWGIDELVAEGRRHWEANAAAPDLAALRMRSRSSEAAALCDPSGLGSWFVATWGNRNRG